MDFEWIDSYCLSKKNVEKDYKQEWEATRYMLRGKMFAMQGCDKSGKPIFTIKLDPILGDMLRQQYKDIVPGYYMNKTHWNSVYLEGEVTVECMKNIIDKAYEAIINSFSKKIQSELI